MVGDDLPQVVARALEQAGLPASRLELELTERSLLDGGERLLTVLRRLRAMGVRLALDDFGTGYASLRHLACFPLDALKIDRSFVANLARPPHRASVQAVIELGHRMGLRVIAEGVERDSQLALLQALGCDDVQGHVHGKPLSTAALGPWLLARARQQFPAGTAKGGAGRRQT
jgi:EAL domain-containing protein (putative c-di-GMP-specific phosphodiesterase class I)